MHQVYALVAAGEAIAMANLNGISDDETLDEIGVNIATGAGGLAATEACTILTEAGKKQTPFNNLKFLPNIAAGYISSLWDLEDLIIHTVRLVQPDLTLSLIVIMLLF